MTSFAAHGRVKESILIKQKPVIPVKKDLVKIEEEKKHQDDSDKDLDDDSNKN